VGGGIWNWIVRDVGGGHGIGYGACDHFLNWIGPACDYENARWIRNSFLASFPGCDSCCAQLSCQHRHTYIQ
jgi:hypothetical protein